VGTPAVTPRSSAPETFPLGLFYLVKLGKRRPTELPTTSPSPRGERSALARPASAPSSGEILRAPRRPSLRRQLGFLSRKTTRNRKEIQNESKTTTKKIKDTKDKSEESRQGQRSGRAWPAGPRRGAPGEARLRAGSRGRSIHESKRATTQGASPPPPSSLAKLVSPPETPSPTSPRVRAAATQRSRGSPGCGWGKKTPWLSRGGRRQGERIPNPG